MYYKKYILISSYIFGLVELNMVSYQMSSYHKLPCLVMLCFFFLNFMTHLNEVNSLMMVDIGGISVEELEKVKGQKNVAEKEEVHNEPEDGREEIKDEPKDGREKSRHEPVIASESHLIIFECLEMTFPSHCCTGHTLFHFGLIVFMMK